MSVHSAGSTGYASSSSPSGAGSSSSPSSSKASSLSSASWLSLSSPPSPPLRYDPRCRAASPETPCPQSRFQRGGRSRTPSGDQSRVHGNPFSRHTDTACDTTCSAVGSNQSGFRRSSQKASREDIPRGASVPSGLTSSEGWQSAHPGRRGTQHAQESQRLASVLPWPSHLLEHQSRSVALDSGPHLRLRPGRHKLDESQERQPLDSSQIANRARHQHRRSFSVQWQQKHQWGVKSRHRVQKLALLLLLLLAGCSVLRRLCSARTPTSTQRTPSVADRLTRAAISPFFNALDQPHRDTVAIYRILGNDLPPRHDEGQTIRNLRFMLSQENSFDFLSSAASSYPLKVEKYYVLNRLTSPKIVDPLCALFEEFGIPQDRILSIPFEWSEYSKRRLRWDQGVASPDNLWGIGQAESDTSGPPSLGSTLMSASSLGNDSTADTRSEDMTRLRAMEYTLHDKNLYAINNNGGRNFALEHGRSLSHARWILPLDGNCFFTPNAMTTLFQALWQNGEGVGHKRYVTIPMIRLLDNGEVLPRNRQLIDPESAFDPMQLTVEAPLAPEEPQIGFRWDAEASYQPEMRYGRRSKLELLWRLGAIPYSRNLHNKQLPWETTDRLYLTHESYGKLAKGDRGDRIALDGNKSLDFIEAGWVHRLFSGDKTMEESTPLAARLRKLNRMKGIVGYIEKLDERLVRGEEGCEEPGSCGFAKERLWRWNLHDLVALRRAARSQNFDAVRRVNAYTDECRNLLASTTVRLRRMSSTKWQSTDSQAIARDAVKLALAGYLASNSTLSSVAADLIRARFIKEDSHTSRQPIAADMSGRSPYEGTGYAFPLSATSDFALWRKALRPSEDDVRFDAMSFDPTDLLDALRLLSPALQPTLSFSRVLPPDQLRSVFSHHLRTLLLSPEGSALSSNPPDVLSAAQYDVKVAVLAAYLDDARLLARLAERHQLRYMDHRTGLKRDSYSAVEASHVEALTSTLEAVDRLHQGLTNVGYPSRLLRDAKTLQDLDVFFTN